MSVRESQVNTLNGFEKVHEASERFIFKYSKENKNLNGIKVYHTDYVGSILFYKYKLAENGQYIEIVNNENFKIKDKVLVSDDSLKASLNRHYSITKIESYNNADLVQIEKKIEM